MGLTYGGEWATTNAYVTKDDPMKGTYGIDSVLLQGQEHVR